MNIVKVIINDWDPIDILACTPSDEYHSEIDEIERLLKSTKNIDELATGIYNVFIKSFGDVSFQKSQAECVLIAKKMLAVDDR